MSIDFAIEGNGVATITINRVEKLNALDDAHYRALSDAWIQVRDDHRIRCAVVTGAGQKSFCAGADLRTEVAKKPVQSDPWLAQGHPVLNRGLEIWKPVIAAVNGYCIGGGCTLLLATDLRVAAEHAQFGLAEVKHGLIAGYGGTQRIMRQLPHAIAMEMLLTGDRITADQALRWGLVNKVVPQSELLPTAYEYADRISRNAPLAVQATKELALRSRDLELADGLRMEQLFSQLLQSTEDVREGQSAFVERRPPRFRGR
ncbi:enoyl-CoA hydratase/isomerase family protein [Paraburkholderia aspalathi]|uniref:enoyl-CoA hydratase/isomerase family protein n=1 Tax=Paraburkholderia aspalathi TaxID=1324617 RepID=UPI001B0CED33|nr:enoyl-CoA hydratase/isomerase family protein [Paraburkholderia aspalathi]CAE6738285.1 Short-chain-enoyl-CoA hydratase [Paraburkholderia aspalathi]